MVSQHLKELYQLCETNQLRLGSSDLIRVVCGQCNEEETCPSVLMEEYDSPERQEPRTDNSHAETRKPDAKS